MCRTQGIDMANLDSKDYATTVSGDKMPPLLRVVNQ
jgi:hypothetical protein